MEGMRDRDMALGGGGTGRWMVGGWMDGGWGGVVAGSAVEVTLRTCFNTKGDLAR